MASLAAIATSILLPPFLARWFSSEEFGAWALSLQAASFLNFLNFGLQLIAARFVATADATNDRPLRDRTVATAIALLLVLGLAGVGVIAILSSRLDLLVPEATPSLRAQMGQAMLWLAASYCVQLPLSILLAVFIGYGRNKVYALATCVGRALTFFAVVCTAYVTRDFVAAAQAWFAATLAAGLIWGTLWWRRSPEPSLRPGSVSGATARRLVRESGPVAIWNLTQLLASHLQILIVARHDYAALPAFASAFALSLVGVGLLQAAGGAIVPRLGASIDDAHRRENKALLYRATRTLNLVLAVGTATLIVGGWWIMGLWLGWGYAASGAALLAPIALFQCIRSSGGTYSLVALGFGVQGRIVLSPIAEAVASFGLALLLAPSLGAVGVALGMCAGALIGLVVMFAQNALHDRVPDLSVVDYVWKGLMLPLVPVFVALAALVFVPLQPLPHMIAALVVSLAAGVLVSNKQDRAFALGLLRRRAAAGK